MRLLILLALAAIASAETGFVQPVCEDPSAYLFRTSREAICLHINKEPKLFDDANKFCMEQKARLVTLLPQTRKISFLSQIIVEQMGDLGTTAWFTDPAMNPHEPAEEATRLVLIAHQDPRMIKILRNDTNVERPFVCESPAQPTTERPQFYLQPEDVQISNEVIEASKNESEKPKIFTVSFHCRAFALPKPAIEWMFVYQNSTTNELVSKPIDAEVIHSLKEAMRELKTDEKRTLFFDRRRDCSRRHCHPDGIMEVSELIIVNPQFLDLERRVACVARNSAGAVLSREAEMIVNHMAEFPEEEEMITVEAGKNVTIPCELETEPDASAEWLRVMPDGKLVRIEDFNQITGGSVQSSKATFDLFIDAAVLADSGRYMCRVQMHNGRFHFVHRDRIVNLNVTMCKENCELKDKPVKVVEGYPTVLSMNPMSNEFVRTGDAFLLECPCSGKRDPRELLRVEWNSTVRMRQLSLLPPGSAMLVEQANEKHTATYACRCVREETKSEWSTIDLAVLPLFAPKEMKPEVAKVGQIANVTCQLPNIHIPGVKIFVTPMRGIRSLFDILREKEDARINLTDKDEKYTISISDATVEDAGIYGCRLAIDYFGKWMEHDTYYTSLRIES